jgi:hypothetical protein
MTGYRQRALILKGAAEEKRACYIYAPGVVLCNPQEEPLP